MLPVWFIGFITHFKNLKQTAPPISKLHFEASKSISFTLRLQKRAQRGFNWTEGKWVGIPVSGKQRRDINNIENLYSANRHVV